MFPQLSAYPKSNGNLELELNNQRRMATAPLFSLLLSIGMVFSQLSRRPESSHLPDAYNMLYLLLQRSFLDIFIVKRMPFPCILVSEGGGGGGGSGGERQSGISCQP